jgi:hypothetical protein
MRGSGTIRIATPLAGGSDGAWRVSAEVDGGTVWFESPDLPLAPSPEAFASAFLVPSLARRRRLISEAPLDPAWLENSPRLVEIFHRWWRYPRLVPGVAPEPPRPSDASPVALAPAPSPAGPDPAPAGPHRERALFFSGGVDSFHALLDHAEPIDRLVFVEGLDIRLGDAGRVESTLAGIRDVATEMGVGLAVVRTNLREHPLIRDTSWENANGGALAAVAHVLADSVEEMLIASSIAVQWVKAWGSHWETDPLFSSSRLRLREVGQELRRIDKVRRIAGHPLPQRHLRVCWENRVPTGNCSRCGKCVITRLMLADSGMLDRYALFDGTATLARDIDALPHDSHRLSLTDLVTHGNLDPELRRAAEALLRRIDHVESFPVKTRRALLRTLRGWISAVRRD